MKPDVKWHGYSSYTYMSTKTIAISGGFDPIHPGHIALIEAARAYGEVHIILNSDEWLIAKKGFVFQSWQDRKKILEVYTPHIHQVDDADGTVCEALARITPTYFGNGGDRTFGNTPELAQCEVLGIEPVFELGGETYRSSSEINARNRVTTRWGWYHVLLDMPQLKLKLLHIEAGKKLSLQRHEKRSEFFFMPNGEVRMNLPGVWHAPRAPEHAPLEIVEVQLGPSEEHDIERISETAAVYEEEVKKKITLNY
jgi:D-beta-D-heptose 7-phosphate kinase/D-beta-D-heptose 1-phosphate adenosyltransferase